jgi:glycosyltransferase involved in cell wall biosynthesis
MKLSIIICTYNRHYNLRDCFECLARQVGMDDIQWEIVLVDNNSTDATRTTVEGYREESFLPIRYTFAQPQGLSHARNHGIQEARGVWLVFIDDDIRVTPNWLRAIYDTFQVYGCDAVGGQIHIDSPIVLPKWIQPDMYGFLGHQDFGDKVRRLDGIREFPFGGNMAMHRRVFDKISPFDTEMGRKGAGYKKDELFKGEETDLFHRLAAAGGTIYYQPTAIVKHKILPHQLEKRFFLTLHRNAGLLQARKDPERYQRTFAGVPWFVFPQLARSIGDYLRIAFSKGPDYAFRRRMTVIYFLGLIVGYYQRDRLGPVRSAVGTRVNRT